MSELRDLISSELAAIFADIMTGTSEEREARLQQLGLTTAPEVLGPDASSFNLYNDGELVGRDAHLDVRGPGVRALRDAGAGRMGIEVPDMTTYVQAEGVSLPPWSIINFTSSVAIPTENKPNASIDIPIPGLTAIEMVFDGDGVPLPAVNDWVFVPNQKILSNLWIFSDTPEDTVLTVSRGTYTTFPLFPDLIATINTGVAMKSIILVPPVPTIVVDPVTGLPVIDPITGLPVTQLLPFTLNPFDLVLFSIALNSVTTTKVLAVLT